MAWLSFFVYLRLIIYTYIAIDYYEIYMIFLFILVLDGNCGLFLMYVMKLPN